LGNNPRTVITNCINLGNVIADSIAGGIVGSINYANIHDCLNAGYLSGKIYIGGIVGMDGGGEVINCINIGVVSPYACIPTQYIGGIIGVGGTASDVFNCHYDKQLCIYGGIGNTGMGYDIPVRAEGHLTRDMVGKGLQSILGDDNWTYFNNLYPIQKYYENNKLCQIAISPVTFHVSPSNYETHFNLFNDFTLNLENGVQ